MIQVITSKQWAWCKSCNGLIVRESYDRIWSHANGGDCRNLVVQPFVSATEDEMQAVLRGSTPSV